VQGQPRPLVRHLPSAQQRLLPQPLVQHQLLVRPQQRLLLSVAALALLLPVMPESYFSGAQDVLCRHPLHCSGAMYHLLRPQSSLVFEHVVRAGKSSSMQLERAQE